MSKTQWYVLGIGAIVIVIFSGVLVFTEKKPQGIACTEEAKICPDGSAVGRTGPKCEFTECSEIKNEKVGIIRVTTPIANALNSSGYEVTGEARGYWYFEASFPVEVHDTYGTLLGTAIAQAQTDWMTENFVPFKATITFSSPTTSNGKIVLEKDNPSGLPQHDDKLELPISFSKITSLKNIKLYYYDDSKDEDSAGNLLCSSKGLVEVLRAVPISMTPIQDALKILIKGELTTLERARGIETEFPLRGLSLTSASLNNGVLTLSWNDPENKTSGGSCRIGILLAQIEATAKQFPEVKSVKMLPVNTFQP